MSSMTADDFQFYKSAEKGKVKEVKFRKLQS